MRHYISEIVTIEEIKKWQPGQRILICSMTGSGKSELIKNQLYDYAKSINKKILLMSNRNLLKQQNVFDLKDKRDVITLENYQAFESRILQGTQDIESLFAPYYFIAEDESHYSFADSAFNANTDLLIGHIKNTPKDKIFIFLTATPEVLLDYQPVFDHTYNIPRDYSYIKNIYFYDRNSKIGEDAVEFIIKNIPQNEKILYFGSSVDDIYELSTRFENSSFICSQGNKLKDKSDIDTMIEIEQTSKFTSRILFATKVLDNGVNIKDNTLKHIIIDTYDPISFIQTLGRKRSESNDDTINLYIRSYHNGMLNYLIKGIENKLSEMDNISKITDGNIKNQHPEYETCNQDRITNIAKYQHYSTLKKSLEKMRDNKYGNGYERYICGLLKKDIRYAKDVFLEFERLSVKEIMEKYIGIKLFQDNQEILKNMFFKTIFVAKKTDYTSRTMHAINNLLEEDNLNFQIIKRREKNGSNRDKYFWMIERKNI